MDERELTENANFFLHREEPEEINLFDAQGFCIEREELEKLKRYHQDIQIHLQGGLKAKNLNYNPDWLSATCGTSHSCAHQLYNQMDFFIGTIESEVYAVMLGLNTSKEKPFLRVEVSGLKGSGTPEVVLNMLEQILTEVDKSKVTRIKNCADLSANM